MTFKLTTLIENHENTELGLAGEHGLSILIESPSHTILFDTGQTGEFLENAKKMKADLSKVDTLVLSHGHFDHSGGVMRFLNEVKDNVDVVLGNNYFVPKYKLLEDNTYLFGGNAFSEDDFREFVHGEIFSLDNEVKQIADGIYVINGFPMDSGFEQLNQKLFRKCETYEVDPFTDEVALVLKVEKGLFVILGCSHRGPVNMIRRIKSEFQLPILGVIGGTHLIDANQERVEKTIKELAALNLDLLALSHCTGDGNIEKLESEFKDIFFLNGSGSTLELK